MGRPSRTIESVGKELLDKAIPVGECLISHLEACSDGYVPTYHGKAHRVVYEAVRGPIGDLWVLHTCDTPSCINPKHLFLGTVQDNVDDMRAKGRDNYTGRPPVLSVEQRTSVRVLHKDGMSHRNLAATFAVSKNTIWRVLRGDYD